MILRWFYGVAAVAAMPRRLRRHVSSDRPLQFTACEDAAVVANIQHSLQCTVFYTAAMLRRLRRHIAGPRLGAAAAHGARVILQCVQGFYSDYSDFTVIAEILQ